MLYIRQLILLAANLYIVRVVLDVLGVEDFGVYSVVAGIVTFCTFLSGSLGSATQRYFSFALGKKDRNLLSSTYSLTVFIYVSIALFSLLLFQTLGLWYVEEKLLLPPERIEAAFLVYQYSVATFVLSILTAPFISIIIAHEDMHYFASISILEALIKLAAVFLLVYVPGDKLVLYSQFLLVVGLITLSIYFVTCIYNYDECRKINFSWQKHQVKDMMSFVGWTMFGQFSTSIRVQAVTILINQYFNPATVAARAIAVTIASKVNLFSNGFNTGIYPAIIKSYASNERKEFESLISNGSKLTFFLMWVFALPLIIEMEVVLGIWLVDIPSEAILFTRLALIEALILSISLPLATAARAPGKMRGYELTLGILQMFIFIFAYLLLSLGHPAFVVFIVAIIVNVVMFFVRLFLVSNLVNISKRNFFLDVCKPMMLLVVTSTLFVIPVKLLLGHGYIPFIMVVFSSMAVSTVAMYFFGLDEVWREKVKSFVLTKFKGKVA
ncbi:oligosaccharide flippase family protein [Vibrio astriarenae]|uniref:Oligosaccharide flippase family protein n=2 Tax=Vibrio astriarenae TaxID=1481923 RepID=A0A7Z2T5G4_9VIBR|nr:oligosaccharide flippase family protein [Vibrio astriarenae]